MTLTTRATHRVDTPGHPPLYCLREEDALDSAQARLPAQSHLWVHVRSRENVETWEFWRMVP